MGAAASEPERDHSSVSAAGREGDDGRQGTPPTLPEKATTNVARKIARGTSHSSGALEQVGRDQVRDAGRSPPGPRRGGSAQAATGGDRGAAHGGDEARGRRRDAGPVLNRSARDGEEADEEPEAGRPRDASRREPDEGLDEDG